MGEQNRYGIKAARDHTALVKRDDSRGGGGAEVAEVRDDDLRNQRKLIV